MKTLIAATALIASVASASAMTSATVELEKYVTPAEAASLSDSQVQVALNAIHSGDSESEIRGFVRSLVR